MSRKSLVVRPTRPTVRDGLVAKAKPETARGSGGTATNSHSDDLMWVSVCLKRGRPRPQPMDRLVCFFSSKGSFGESPYFNIHPVDPRSRCLFSTKTKSKASASATGVFKKTLRSDRLWSSDLKLHNRI